MPEGLKELQSLSKRLNEASDDLNEILSQIEDKLEELNLGLTVWLDDKPLGSKEIKPPRVFPHAYSAEEVYLLGYTKIGGEWGLAVKIRKLVHGFYHGDDGAPYTQEFEEKVTPLLSRSRQLRARALELLPNLFAALKEEALDVIDSIENAKALVNTL